MDVEETEAWARAFGPNGILVLYALRRFLGNKEWCWPSVSCIAKTAHVHRVTAAKILKRATELLILERIPAPEKKRTRLGRPPYMYRLL